MIYFLQALDGGPVKIGTTDNIDVRRKQLESMYRRPLALLATLPGGTDEESTLHERFGHLRLGRTEQFRPAPELMAYIERPLLVGANPDTVEVMRAVRPIIIRLKGYEEFDEWLSRLAAHRRLQVSVLIEHALIEYAENHEFTDPAPER